MKFIGDLHIHSHFSRATAKNLDFENLYITAQRKGITVVGTGDVTHPGWFNEIEEKLVSAEPGLFKLRDELAAACDQYIPQRCRGPVRFMLSSEISNIYKKNGKTRKNHNIVFFPDLTAAEQFNEKLEGIGNIHSDGRPILGLDAKHLLEITLSISDQAFLVPAHIWTPWFSLFGSKSGFDSIEECFEDLTPHIFAVETGLSSDPVMNWQVSNIDGLTLISNSDAHSPAKLGREANLFDTELSFEGIRTAIETGDPDRFLGTIEFFPEEGKYHLDGHRKCKIRLLPEETATLKGICPVCNKPLTFGVLSRVEALADRKKGQRPSQRHPYYHLSPLVDILSEILQVGPNTKKVNTAYNTILSQLGSELTVLNDIPKEQLDAVGIPLLGEGIHRMRSGRVTLEPGYDGEFGTIRLFQTDERQKLMGQKPLFSLPSVSKRHPTPPRAVSPPAPIASHTDSTQEDETITTVIDGKTDHLLDELNSEQRKAVTCEPGPLVIVAGPGTGKTHTLTHRIAYLIKQNHAPSDQILAVTFTNKAAREMSDRLKRLLENKGLLPFVSTFHGLCLHLLMEGHENNSLSIIDEIDQKTIVRNVVRHTVSKDELEGLSVEEVFKTIVTAKQNLLTPLDFYGTDVSKNKVISKIYKFYQQYLEIQDLLDYEDIIVKVALGLEHDQVFREECQNRFRHIFVDEYQDVNQGQYRIVRSLASPGKHLCVIGDPDQSIYGFRGSDHRYFTRFLNDYPNAKVVNLNRNYRSSKTILDASYNVISNYQLKLSNHEGGGRIYSHINGQKSIHLLELGTDRGEAMAVSRAIEALIGGTGFDSFDFGRVDGSDFTRSIGFSDIAVLYRTGDQHRIIADVFLKQGIPFQVASCEKKNEVVELRQLLSLFKTIEGVGHYGDFERIIKVWYPRLVKEIIYRFSHWGIQNSFKLKQAQYHAGRIPIPGVKKHHQEKLIDFFKILSGFKKQMKGLSVAEKLRFLIARTRFNKIQKENSDVLRSFKGLLKSAAGYEGRVVDFLSSNALENDVDTVSFQAERVTMMTMHAAKGLEFSVVFIVGCENGFVPYFKESEQPSTAEERRLFYVAMTRAKHQLFLSWAQQRLRYGKRISREVSPFILDIEKKLILQDASTSKGKPKRCQKQLELF